MIATKLGILDLCPCWFFEVPSFDLIVHLKTLLAFDRMTKHMHRVILALTVQGASTCAHREAFSFCPLDLITDDPNVLLPLNKVLRIAGSKRALELGSSSFIDSNGVDKCTMNPSPAELFCRPNVTSNLIVGLELIKVVTS